MNRLKQYYKNLLEEDLLLKQNPRNIQNILKISRINLNNSSKNYPVDEKLIIPNLIAVELLSGQTCKNSRSKKSIANFKLVKDSLIGFQVCFRKDQLYSILDKFLILVAPNIKSFKAYNKNQFLDVNGISLSIISPMLFPEFEENRNIFEHISPYDLSLITNGKSKKESILLLSGFQVPFTKESF